MNTLQLLWDYLPAFLSGLGTTFQLVVATAIIGSAIGLLLERLAFNAPYPVRATLDALAFCLSSIPALVVLFWLHYPAQTLLGIVVDPFWTALAALVLINVFSVYRMIDDAVMEFPKQYVASALVCGLTPQQIARQIQLPLLLRAVLPRWIDQQVVILHTSLFASLISVEEIFRVAQRVNSVVYKPVLIYTAMAILFLITAGTALYLSAWLRRLHHRDLSER